MQREFIATCKFIATWCRLCCALCCCQAVTFSTFICGYYPLLHSAVYVIMQVVGAICGSLLVNSLTPYDTIYVGMGDGGPGCFDQKSINHDISKSQIFGWEVVMTFTLISTVYACGIAKPGHGSMTPLAVGFSLIACAGAGGKYTGAALNPARVLGPLAVYKCGKDVAVIYILAELLAALLACVIFSVVSGWGPLFPYKSMKTFDMTWDESLYMFLTGQPPKRYRQNGDENVNSLRGVLRNPRSFMGRATSKVRKSRKSTDSVEEEPHSPDAKSVDHMV